MIDMGFKVLINGRHAVKVTSDTTVGDVIAKCNAENGTRYTKLFPDRVNYGGAAHGEGKTMKDLQVTGGAMQELHKFRAQ